MTFDEAAATPIVLALVSRKREMFQQVRGFCTFDDRVAAVMHALRRAWPRFDPGRSSFCTWINRIGGCELIDLWRVSSRKVNHDTTYAQLRRQTATSPREADEPADLIDWLGRTHRAILCIFKAGSVPLRLPKDPRTGPDRAQRSALLLLIKRLKLSTRGAELMLRQRPELLAAIRLRKVPSYRFFARLEKSVTNIRRSEAAAAA